METKMRLDAHDHWTDDRGRAIIELERAQQEAQAYLELLKPDIPEFRKDITQLIQQVDVAEHDIVKIKKRVDDLEYDTVTNEEYDQLEDRLTELRKEVSSLQTQKPQSGASRSDYNSSSSHPKLNRYES